jgi:hypothetical protein
MHLWPHGHGASLGIVEGGSRRGTLAIVAAVVTGAGGVIVLAFPLLLALTLAFAAIVGVWGSRGGAA